MLSERTPMRVSEPVRSGPGWWRMGGRFLALLLVFGFFAVMVRGGKFYSPRNLENIARQSAVFATAALGMTMVIIAAGIDLSVGSMIALAVVVAAWVLNGSSVNTAGQRIPWIESFPRGLPWMALGLALLASTLAGMLNGLLVVRLRLVPFIVTLGTMGIYRGIAKGIAGEKDIYPDRDTWLTTLMDPTLASGDPSRRGQLLPTAIWLLLLAAFASAAVLRYTRFGRHLYAIGSNEETARLCGVPVARRKILVYAISGFFAGLAGLMVFADIGGIGQPTAAVSYELYVIAAVVIGGGSLRGGEGSVLGAILGALIITILSMGGQQMGWDKWIQEIVIGGITIAAVAVDQLRQRYATQSP